MPSSTKPTIPPLTNYHPPPPPHWPQTHYSFYHFLLQSPSSILPLLLLILQFLHPPIASSYTHFPPSFCHFLAPSPSSRRKDVARILSVWRSFRRRDGQFPYLLLQLAPPLLPPLALLALLLLLLLLLLL